jgi:hypothetical protein
MYFPIIRGRQYDLLALRELKSKGHLSKKIIPIIEPIKLNSTLMSTISTFEENECNLIVISNPKVGSLIGELSLPSIYQQYKEIMLKDYVIIGHHFNRDSQAQINKLVQEFNISLGDLVIIHSERSLVNQYKNIFGNATPWVNVIPLDNSFRRQLNGQELVGLDDKFIKLPRNADYLDQETEFFSEEHLFFQDEGYIGFSDYSVVGQEYSESGFAPYAVAIHIVYPDPENALEIMHFVSDSNNDTRDPAGKFAEALEKLIQWYQPYSIDERMNTLAMQSFIQHHKDGTYPGLPTIKKLSIMHHLELVGTLLD